jgi:hypothetical protein
MTTARAQAGAFPKIVSGLSENIRIAVINRNPVQGAFPKYSDRDY